MSTELVQSSRSFPVEIEEKILAYADTGTLAKACAVSLAFLQMAAPLLYRDITFVSPEGLKKFLTLRANVHVPTLAPYLDLSLVHSITVIDPEEETCFGFQPDIVCPTKADLLDFDEDAEDIFVPYRLLAPGEAGPTFSPLKIHSLLIRAKSRFCYCNWYFFDSVHIRIEGNPYHASDREIGSTFSNPPIHRWTRLIEFTSVDITSEEPFFEYHDFGSGPVTVRWELSAESSEAQTLGYVAADLIHTCSGGLSNVSQIEIQVATQGLKEYMQSKIIGCALFARTTILVKPAEDASSASGSASLMA